VETWLPVYTRGAYQPNWRKLFFVNSPAQNICGGMDTPSSIPQCPQLRWFPARLFVFQSLISERTETYIFSGFFGGKKSFPFAKFLDTTIRTTKGQLCSMSLHTATHRTSAPGATCADAKLEACHFLENNFSHFVRTLEDVSKPAGP
jgi:hypothetical protein